MLVHANLEQSEEGDNAVALTLYFDEFALESEVLAVIQANPRLCLAGENESADPAWDKYPTPVSERAGLVRYQVFP